MSERGKGDITAYAPETEVTIGDTFPSESSKITWVHIKDGLKHIYVCKQVLATNISWDYLNERNMIYGTPVTIDGKQYKLRVLTGGNSNNTNGIGALPEDNEWDTIVCNTANITGLPKPTTEDLTETNTYGQLDGKNNDMWNWWGIATICQDKYNAVSNVVRGYESAKRFTWYNLDNKALARGWRPVLEYIESNPPEKPTITYPTGDITNPSVLKDKPLTIKTQFNNPGGEFTNMKITIRELFTHVTVVDKLVGTLNYEVTEELNPRGFYTVTIFHNNTAGQQSPPAYAYFIYGELGKYKLSEPITIKRSETLKAYSQGQQLIMKPQTYPKTESSVVRLVPQVMNNLTVGGVTGNKLQYTATTKQPVAGDRLIKDKEIYTISSIQEGSEQTNFSKELFGRVLTEASESNQLSFGTSLGSKTYTYNGKVYVAVYDLVPKLFEIDMITGETTIKLNTGISDGKNFSLTGFEDKLIMTVANGSTLNIYKYNIAKNKVYSISHNIDYKITYIDTAYDHSTNELAIVVKLNQGTTQYSLMALRFDLTSFDSNAVLLTETKTLISPNTLDYFGNPTICNIHGIGNTNINIIYPVKKTDASAQVMSVFWKDRTISTAVIMNISATAQDVKLVSQYISGVEDNPVWIATVTYNYNNTSQHKILTYMRTASDIISTKEMDSPSKTITIDMRVTRDKKQGYILILRTYGNTIYKCTRKNIQSEWSPYKSVFSMDGANLEQVFDIIDYFPYEYGDYPGIIYKNYVIDTKRVSLNIQADYSMEKPKVTAVILDKPITTHAGETIKFLDYDLEVKAGEETATVTPTNITNDYYEYEAEFDKKQEERKVTVVGRNSKLTTLYYYNY
ncbi:hypothetical protein [Clostridium botulinum]|uniref:hypothetical protein n=1 Tax=Clostridium botulinum TaxID=1491 RepID=UPI000FCC9C80|nr:hypothetical protein [Clostridium botulinum]